MRNVYAVFIAVLSLVVSLSACSQENSFPARYLEGVHYTKLSNPVPTSDPEKIEVVEVFWYACSHCYNLEPTVHAFEQNPPSGVKFVRVPAIWQPIMETHARIFYTAEVLGILDDVHQAVFNAIHLNRKPLQSADEVATLFADFGADREEVIKTFNGGEVTQRLKDDMVKVRGYQITGTPQLIVDGRYRVEANRNIRQDDMFSVVNFLVDQIRHEQ